MTFADSEIMIGYFGNWSSLVFVLQNFALFISFVFILQWFRACNFIFCSGT